MLHFQFQGHFLNHWFLKAGKLPDAVVACVGGGSNAIGLFHPFIDEPTEIIGVEAGGDVRCSLPWPPAVYSCSSDRPFGP